MKYAFIGTWRMAYEAIKENINLLKSEDKNGEAIVRAISMIEDNQYFKSVGFGGLPNENCEVELDAGFMNGQTLQVGALAGVSDISNPIKVARSLSKEKYNSFLVGDGGKEYAKNNGFLIKNMLSDRAISHYNKRKKMLSDNPHLSPYDGHDTVGMVSLDIKGNIFSATSTSGLFMKKKGRIGDSPIVGSGFYCETEIGGATATGLGEDIFKGCLSFEVVRQIKDGKNIKELVQDIVCKFTNKLKTKLGSCGSISIVAIDKNGNWGVGTNCEFSFVVGNYQNDVKIYIAKPSNDLKKLTIIEPNKKWLDEYDKSRKGPIL
ncbi:N(4)-(beta-N-acetylglucosaminyl)-L-asparaginase [Spiroplasma endosymbiont of Aspidapion aeneum]|uniref:N(4)-(beta-N-acetylglucosaminyl)-L-asparaginase n=1 Tax=Spiroplasma endosymbiont of Aspidapion aeneum TaxID=3066276 RepID=UPI00313B954B